MNIKTKAKTVFNMGVGFGLALTMSAGSALAAQPAPGGDRFDYSRLETLPKIITIV